MVPDHGGDIPELCWACAVEHFAPLPLHASDPNHCKLIQLVIAGLIGRFSTTLSILQAMVIWGGDKGTF